MGRERVIAAMGQAQGPREDLILYVDNPDTLPWDVEVDEPKEERRSFWWKRKRPRGATHP
jgi:hypothetical protein